MCLYPFNHFSLSGVFDTELYAALVAQLPDSNLYDETPDPQRLAFGLHERKFDRLGAQQKAFWQELSTWLLADDLIEVLVDKFKLPTRVPGANYRYQATAALT